MTQEKEILSPEALGLCWTSPESGATEVHMIGFEKGDSVLLRGLAGWRAASSMSICPPKNPQSSTKSPV